MRVLWLHMCAQLCRFTVDSAFFWLTDGVLCYIHLSELSKSDLDQRERREPWDCIEQLIQ